MFKFLNSARNRELAAKEQRVADTSKLNALVAKGAAGDDLSPGDAKELDRLSRELGVPIEKLESDASDVTDEARLARLFATVPTKLQLHHALRARLNSYREETDAIAKNREAGEKDLLSECQRASFDLDRARDAEFELAALRKKRGTFIPRPAHLIEKIDVASIRLSHQRDRQRDEGEVARSGGIDSPAIREAAERAADSLAAEAAAVEHHQKQALAVAASGVQVFALGDDLRNTSIDPAEWSFAPIPGVQSESEFSELLNRLKRAIAERDKRITVGAA